MGERPKAFITLAAGQRVTEQEIIGFCRQHLAHFKAPAAVEFADLPKTSAGKVQKYVLRERERAGRDQRVNQRSAGAAAETAEPSPATGGRP